MPKQLKKEVKKPTSLIKKEVKEVEKQVKKVEEKFIPDFLHMGDLNSKKLLDPDMFKAIFKAKKNLTVGQRAADWLTKWAGSWAFILTFALFLVFWVLVNTTWVIFGREWDIYPFILLNLILSCLAAIQAPIILMSQNRSNQRDRMRSEYDYAVNRKAEKEIREIQQSLEEVKRLLGKK